ncbi:hypothetical protein EDD18DRAFT_1108062 [Armillaria luteobubalina]|uniref:Uncharacterized protein n=1 Tax=Armillaria luteobubalina TaxID=153913 RepID=A0AA39PZ90_9AGAR|nr:hypothetical protein EDD18DRAFT_1108062 [Armillaria luteobubalina]
MSWNKHVKPLMSAFVDLEAGVDRQEVLESNDEEVDDFIEDADNEDNTSDAVNAPTTDPSAVTPLLGQSEVEDPWTELLDRARMRAIRGPTVGERHDDVSIHDVPPEFWVLTIFAGWEDVVVFHIGRCARPEHRIKAAFMMPVLEKQVWLEAEIQKNSKQRRLDKLAPKLFDHGAIELDGTEKVKVVKQKEEQYLWRSFVYEHDLLVHRVNFSQVELVHEIPDILTRTKDEVKMREVHPNLLMVSTPPSSLPPAPKKDQELIHPTKNISWKGTLVTITRPHHRWRSKTGYVKDVNMLNNSYGRPGLRVLVCLAAYNPNMPYPDAWFDYLNIIDEETHLPLNEALPLADNDDNLYHKYVPVTHFLEERGRRVRPELEPQSEADPGNHTPLPDPSERCLLPAWDPSTPEPGSSMVVSSPTYWCTDQRLHGYKFRAIYHGLKISAAVHANSIGGGGLKCVRDDMLAHEELDPAAVLPIHPTSRHYDLFLVISGEHCGKWVRGIQFKKGASQDRSDLEWTVVVVIPRAPYLQDDLTDERLVLHSSCMTLANESAQEQKLNNSLKRLLWKPARER